MEENKIYKVTPSPFCVTPTPNKVSYSDTAVEITVTIKDEEKSLKTKYLIYDLVTVSEDDPIIKDCIARALKNFEADPTDIRVKIHLEVL